MEESSPVSKDHPHKLAKAGTYKSGPATEKSRDRENSPSVPMRAGTMFFTRMRRKTEVG
jgi:hypothetical protein